MSVSLIGVHSKFALCFMEGVAASCEWSEKIRITARRVRSHVLSGRRDTAHVMALGSIGSRNPPTSLTWGAK